MEEHKSSTSFPPLVRYPLDILHSFTSIINDEALEEIREDFEMNLSQQMHPSPALDELHTSEEIPEEIQENLSENSSSDPIQFSASKDPWTCGICKDIYLDPVESICCHELFCEKCVISNNKCPKCRTSTKWIANLPVRRIVEEIVVKCRHPQCTFSFKRNDLIKHEKVCELALLQCRNSILCGSVCRKDFQSHCEISCEYRPVECTLKCGKTLPLCDLESHLSYDCSNAEVQCPQNCKAKLQRKEIDYHILHTCQLSVVSCMFFSYDGDYCGYKCFRSELEEHQLTCNLRKVRCSNNGCHQRIVYKFSNEHDEVCKFKKTQCSNGCGGEMIRGAIEEHFKVCELQKIACSYSIVGCEVVLERRYLDNHLEEDVLRHSQLMVLGVKESSHRIEKLNFDVQCAKEMVTQEIAKIKLQLSKKFCSSSSHIQSHFELEM